MRSVALLLALALWGSTGSAAATAAPGPWLLVVSGISGDETRREAFVELSLRLVDAAVQRYGVPAERVRYLAESTESSPERIDGRSTREGIEEAFRWIAGSAAADDPVWIVLIGHGSAQGGDARFNLPGPDLGAQDFAVLLEQLSAQRVAFVNTTSSSGGFLPAVAGSERIVVTATRGAHEREETRFAEFFVDAYATGDADTDRDGQVSVLEAFVYATAEVRRAYEAEGRLLTEHALLEDDGDGAGSRQPDPEAGDGARAGRMLFGGPAGMTARQAEDPELARLVTRRQGLQAELDALRGRRQEMQEAAYLEALEEILVQIAEIDRQIRERTGEGR